MNVPSQLESYSACPYMKPALDAFFSATTGHTALHALRHLNACVDHTHVKLRRDNLDYLYEHVLRTPPDTAWPHVNALSGELTHLINQRSVPTGLIALCTTAERTKNHAWMKVLMMHLPKVCVHAFVLGLNDFHRWFESSTPNDLRHQIAELVVKCATQPSPNIQKSHQYIQLMSIIQKNDPQVFCVSATPQMFNRFDAHGRMSLLLFDEEISEMKRVWLQSRTHKDRRLAPHNRCQM